MSVTIALVEDQQIIRKGLKELLESFGEIKVVVETDSGATLLEKLSARKSLPYICVISSQAFMARDIWTVREIKKSFDKMKILILASHLHELSITRLFHEKANGFILKNAKPEEFKKAVFALHTKGMYWPEFSNELLEAISKDEYSHRTIRKHHVQFMELCCEDITYNEISKKMSTNIRTLESYRDYLFEKFNVGSRSSLVLYAIKNGFIDLK
jgi:DNA-binding NarL/FixJ family response regulator